MEHQDRATMAVGNGSERPSVNSYKMEAGEAGSIVVHFRTPPVLSRWGGYRVSLICHIVNGPELVCCEMAAPDRRPQAFAQFGLSVCALSLLWGCHMLVSLASAGRCVGTRDYCKSS